MGELNQVQKLEAQYYKISNTLILFINKICQNFLQSNVVAYIILQCHEWDTYTIQPQYTILRG